MATTKSTDIGFNVLRNHAVQVDSVTGKGKSMERLLTIIYDEVVLPGIAKKAGKNDFGGGLVMYYGDVLKQVNWDSINVVLKAKYPDLADAVFISAKPQYYQWVQDWPQFVKSINSYLDSPFRNNLSKDQLNGCAMNIFGSVNNKEMLESALNWSKQTLTDEGSKNVGYLYTYSKFYTS